MAEVSHPLSVLLLETDPAAVAVLALAFAPVSADVLATVAPEAVGRPVSCRVLPTEAKPGSAAAARLLADAAAHPWLLVVPAGLRPGPGVVPWLQRALADLPAGCYLGLGASLVADASPRPWLVHGRPTWWDGPPLRPGGERGEDLPTTLQTGLTFQAPAPLSDWYGLGEADLSRYLVGLEDVLARFPHSVRAHYEMAECLRLTGRHLEAYDVLQRAWGDPLVREAWVPGELPGLLARVALEIGDSDAAMAFARFAVDQDVDHLPAWELLTRLRFKKDGAKAALAEAEGWWAACMRGAPEATRIIAEQPVVMAECIRHLVWSLTANGRLDVAREFSTLGEAPPDLPVHIALESNLLDAAVDLLVSHQSESQIARRRWDKMLQAAKGAPDFLKGLVWSSLGGGYYRQLALGCFDRVIAALPDVADVYWRRAMVLAMKPSGLADARTDLYKALRLEPRSAMLWRKLAEVCRLLGDEPGAQTAFREASRLGALMPGR